MNGFDTTGGSPLSGGDWEAGLGAYLRYWQALILRNLPLIGAIIGGFLVLAIIATMLTAPRYTAETSVQINDQREQVLGEDIEGPSAANTGWDVERFLNTQIDILRSRALAERVARKLDLWQDERFYTAMGAVVPDGSTPKQDLREGVIAMLRGGLSTDLPRDTRIARVRFTTTDPQMSAKIANGFAEEFIQGNLQRRFDSSAYARQFVAEQLEEARVRLENSERELNDYARGARLIRTREAGQDAPAGAGSVTAASLMQLNEAANAAQATRIEAEGRWAAERNSPLLASRAVLANPTVQGLMSRRAQLQADLQAARARYLGDHPAIANLESQLASTNTQLQQAAQEVRASVQAEFVAARTAEARLRAQVDRLEAATLSEQDRSVRYNTLAREADTNRSIYEGLLQRFRELNASAGISASNIAIIDKAEPPSGPSSPNLAKNLAIALLLGGFLAGAIVFVRDQLDDRVRVPEDVEHKVQLPLLGVVPDAGESDALDALDQPRSPLSEAYSSLRGALLYSTAHGLPQIMLVTSAEAAEGKTTTSYAIARGLAQAGKKVVLVDADLRRPSMHRLTGADNTRGLSSLLTSDDPAKSAVIATGRDNLWLIPAVPVPPSPAELLAGPRLAALLEELESDFDAVIIDSAPVFGLADSPALAALADGVVIVIEAGRGRHGALKAALRRLRAMEAHVIGAVLTKFDASQSANAYSAYYRYNYYRDEEAEAQA